MYKLNLEFKNPENAAPPAARYSNLVVIPEGSKILCIAGQIGNLQSGEILDGLETQYDQALRNINSIIESEGGTKQNLAKMTVFLTEEPTDWKSIGKANEEHLNTPRPAMSWVYVSKLFKPEVKVEIEATAAL